MLFSEVPAALPDTPLLIQKIHFEQAWDGLLALRLIQARIAIGNWTPQNYEAAMRAATDAYHVAAELEPTKAGRVRCYERRIVFFKEFEQYMTLRWEVGSDPPYNVYRARFDRLQAEAELLRFQANPWSPHPGLRTTGGVAKLPKYPAWAGSPQHDPEKAGRGGTVPPGYSAFPHLLPPPNRTDGGHDPAAEARATDALFAGTLFPISADASLLRRVQYDQVAVGVLALRLINQKLRSGDWFSSDEEGACRLQTAAFRVAAEAAPAERRRLLEARVVLAKDFERSVVARYEAGNDPPHSVCRARFARLEAEAELHELNESLLPPCSVAAPSAAAWCVPACPPQPRAGLFRRR